MTSPCNAPLSWLRLESYALGIIADDERITIASHLAQCTHCKVAFATIENDVVSLPALTRLQASLASGATPIRRPQMTRWYVAGSAVAAAAAVFVWVGVNRKPTQTSFDPTIIKVAAAGYVKGVGTLVLRPVRERHGAITLDADSFLSDDRWKVSLTCAPDLAPAPIQIGVSVIDGSGVSTQPLPPAQIDCGNNVVVPGAFTITGTGPQQICVSLTANTDLNPSSTRLCVTVSPQR
jgi:anti-sigma factor RsiW